MPENNLKGTVDQTIQIARSGLGLINKNSYLDGLNKKYSLKIVDKIENQIKQIRNILEYEREPPQIAVVGQINSGKSTILNLLLGKELAAVGFDEKQCIPVGYHCVDRNQEKFYGIQPDGTNVNIDCDLFTQIEKGHNPFGYLAIKREMKSEVFKGNVVLWDTPGLFGSEINQNNLEDYVDVFDVMVWVFDGSSLGGLMVNNAFREALKSGKKIIPALNFIENKKPENLKMILGAAAEKFKIESKEWLIFSPEDLAQGPKSDSVKKLRSIINDIVAGNEKLKWAMDKLKYRLSIERGVFNDFCNKTYMNVGALNEKIKLFESLESRYESGLRKKLTDYALIIGSKQEKEINKIVRQDKKMSDPDFKKNVEQFIETIDVDGELKKMALEELETVIYEATEKLQVDSKVYIELENLSNRRQTKEYVLTNQNIYVVTEALMAGGVLGDAVIHHGVHYLLGDMIFPGAGFVGMKIWQAIQEENRASTRFKNVEVLFERIRHQFQANIDAIIIEAVKALKPQINAWIVKEKQRFEVPGGMDINDVEHDLVKIHTEVIDKLFLPTIVNPSQVTSEEPRVISWEEIIEMVSKAQNKVFLRSSFLDAAGLETIINRIGSGVELDFRITFLDGRNKLEDDLNDEDMLNRLNCMKKLQEKFRMKPIGIKLEKRASGNDGQLVTRLMVIDDVLLIWGNNEFREFKNPDSQKNRKNCFVLKKEYKNQHQKDLICFLEEYKNPEKFCYWIKSLNDLDSVSRESVVEKLGTKFRISPSFS